PYTALLRSMDEGRIVNDSEIKESIAKKYPYQKWLDDNLVHLKDIPYNECPVFFGEFPLETRTAAFGYTQEDIDTIIMPMAHKGTEPIGSMGSDTPIAVLSERPQ